MSTEDIERRRRIWDRMAPRYDRAMRLTEAPLFGRDTARRCAGRPAAKCWRSPSGPA